MTTTIAHRPQHATDNDLLDAIERDDLAAVTAALDAGASPNVLTEDGEWSAVQHAVLSHHHAVLDVLIAHGADVNITGFDERAPAYLALTRGGTHENFVPLVRAGADMAYRVGPAGIEFRNHIGRTLLHMAIGERPVQEIQLLLERGADPNARDAKGCTPMHYAIDDKSGAKLLALVQGGGDIEACDNRGCRPLHRAVYYDSMVGVRVLRALGASTWGVMSEGKALDRDMERRPLEAAVFTESPALVMYALEHQAPSQDEIGEALALARKRKLGGVADVLRTWQASQAARLAMEQLADPGEQPRRRSAARP